MSLDLIPGFGAFTPATGGGGTGTTWNSADKSGDITLSGSDLIATRATGTASYVGVRSVSSKSSGKYYFEIEVTYVGSGGNEGFGVANGTASLTNYPGGDLNSIGEFPDNTSSAIYINAGSVGTLGSIASATRIGVAVDLDTDVVGFTLNGSSYSDEDISTLNAGPYFIMGSLYGNATAVRLYTSSASWSWSARSGHGEWTT
jgi:hypothetical protein